MPSLTLKELEQFSTIECDYFVETGTFEGDTVNTVLNSFNKIYSIELSEKYASLAKKRFISNSHVEILNGDSGKLMEDTCKRIHKPTFFWLDGHYSGGDTAKGDKDCPLHEEIRAIMKYLKSECIVAIDDVRLFNKKMSEDWTEITYESIFNICLPRLRKFSFYPSVWDSKDRLVIQLDPI